jgi:hypothetical protein
MRATFVCWQKSFSAVDISAAVPLDPHAQRERWTKRRERQAASEASLFADEVNTLVEADAQVPAKPATCGRRTGGWPQSSKRGFVTSGLFWQSM